MVGADFRPQFFKATAQKNCAEQAALQEAVQLSAIFQSRVTKKNPDDSTKQYNRVMYMPSAVFMFDLLSCED